MDQTILNSKEFQEFLQQFQIDPSYFTQDLENIPRYIRISPNKQISIEQLQNDLNCEEIKQTSITDIYAIPSQIKIAQSKLYKDGILYGIDYSSACVVIALNAKHNDNIVEICCAPGAKLCMISDLMQKDQQISGSITGVDISEHRMNTCRQIIKKYGHNINLVQQDGCEFGESNFYDKVLIDAECTHDGSIKHILKFKNQFSNQKLNTQQKKQQKQNKITNKYISEPKKQNDWSFDDFKDRFLDQKKLQNILKLQRQLLDNGFRILKNNGHLVYSTCSFSQLQNEDIIEQFMMDINKDKVQAKLIKVFDDDNICYKETRIENAIRFDMETTQSGGMFIAKILKLM